jgi:hypothetical protein
VVLPRGGREAVVVVAAPAAGLDGVVFGHRPAARESGSGR